ncbi:MAG: sugar phosphate isomerase/epimerase family protein [Bryobacteraceae bacterium]
MTRRTFAVAAAAAVRAAGAPARRTSMGLTPDSLPARRFAAPEEFVELCGQLGMGGCQISLRPLEPDLARRIRRRTEELGLYVVIGSQLPGEDVAQFERTVQLSKEAGAVALRLPTGQRRYEQFSTLEQRRAHVARVRKGIERAVPIAERARLPLGLENHKDWTLEEQLALYKEFPSEYFGACVDVGNSIALLEDPMEVVEGLAPYAVTTHFKNMAVEEYEQGFLLSEVPLADGILDLKRVVDALRARRPKIHFALEMITRDPLKVPCLTDKYWVTFPERNGRFLARTLAMVRRNKPVKPLPRVTGLGREAVLKLEMDNVEQCIAYARDRLGLV